MLFEKRFWAGIADGSITVTFRRWKGRRAKPGSAHRTPMGLLEIEAVDVIQPEQVTDDDAVRAGYSGRGELLADLRAGDGELYRVAFHHAGPDPREALRARSRLDDAEWETLVRRLSRLDAASGHGPWTRQVLELIAARPATRAPDLAESLGRDTLPFKRDVRKLKELGLTESLERGYRLSPRGRAALRRLSRGEG